MLHIVDTSTYLFRAWVTLPLSIALPGKGGPANALYGLLGTLAKLVREKKVERIVCVLDDVAADDERIALDPSYKSKRREFPAELERQNTLAPEALAAAGFATAWLQGWEADDLIGTVALQAHKKREKVTIVGVDKDLLQALAPGDALYDLARERLIPHAEASCVLGVAPERTADFLALSGDSVDEIAGVPGIGKKTAALLINALGGVAEIYSKLDRVLALKDLRGAKSVHARLKEHEADARRALTLATLKANAPWKLDLAACDYRGTTAKGREVLREKFGFERLSERFPKADA
ncbi:hypothetical protein HY251_00455 [bacterium]|nr:hypothetical protein [bacterium]